MPGLPTDEEPGGTHQVPAVDELVPQRQHLREALLARDPRLADIYEAVTHLMGRDDVPDALSLTAHAMRELMDNLPLAFDLPVDQKHRLFSRLDQLGSAVAQAIDNSTCRNGNGWSGEIDEHLAKVVEITEVLIEERRQYWPSRRVTAGELMIRLEPGPGRPEKLREEETKFWVEARHYFEEVSHHHHVFGKLSIDGEAFGELVRMVERLLLAKLRPSTAQEYSEIDRLMEAYLEAADG